MPNVQKNGERKQGSLLFTSQKNEFNYTYRQIMMEYYPFRITDSIKANRRMIPRVSERVWNSNWTKGSHITNILVRITVINEK